MPGRRFIRLLLLLLLGAGAAQLRADSRESAFFARVLMGPETWSRVLLIENEAPTQRYPARFHALVFEFEGMLWFYTESDGTQGLSREAGRLGEEKRQVLALVRALHPGFARVTDAASDEPPLYTLLDNKLPRGCFLYCLLNWRRLEGVSHPSAGQLLTYYLNTPEGRRGHTVLLYRYGKRHFLYDPADTELERPLPAPPPEDPLEAATLLGRRSAALIPVAAVLLDVHRTGRRVKQPSLRARALTQTATGALP